MIFHFSEFELSDYIKFENVCLKFDGKLILDDVSFTIPRHETTMIVGSSGSGKTSILNCITGKIPPISGKVFVGGYALHEACDRLELRKNIGMLFQQSGLFQDLTVAENVALPYYEHYPNLTSEQISIAVKLKLHAVGLRGVLHKYPSQLSGGMERRVALARAIALDPSLILYDEPLTGQDPISCGVLISLVQALKQAYGATSVIVSHQINVLAKYVDRVLVIGDKKVLINDTVKQVMQSELPYVKQFLSGNPDGVVAFHHEAIPLADDLERGDLL